MVVSTLKVVDEYFDKLRTVTEKKALQASLASIARKADDRFDSLGYSTSVMKMTEGTSVARMPTTLAEARALSPEIER